MDVNTDTYFQGTNRNTVDTRTVQHHLIRSLPNTYARQKVRSCAGIHAMVNTYFLKINIIELKFRFKNIFE